VRSTYCERYSTYSEALAGHQRIVQALRRGEIPPARSESDETTL